MSTSPQKPVPPKDTLDLGEPYCGACGHRLTGLVDSTRCPECGRPIIEVVTRAGKLGKRYRSQTTMFGLPLVDIAIGATHSETRGTARGVFAIGDYARGLVAVGNSARGVVAIGGRAIGVFSVGGMAFGLVSAWGGISVGAIAAGGLVLGLIGFGGMCAAMVATGGVCIGLYAAGGAPILVLQDVAASMGSPGEVFSKVEWFTGPGNPFRMWRYFLQPNAVTAGLPIAAAVVIGLMAFVRHSLTQRTTPTP
ncbi:MAG: hypothetical protein HKO59_11590 [Phycisphaerales bacterium]|nr:hypothetical protein [Phycisphaerae bacterium]NNF41434.1 hypothetical protein [Phycisphaerales bacterium]NNM26605.1 hypothetical protein [Phycisphaerales bacterium]